MKKKKYILVGLVCVLLLVAFLGWKIVPGYSLTIEANWGISLPWKALCKEIYPA